MYCCDVRTPGETNGSSGGSLSAKLSSNSVFDGVNKIALYGNLPYNIFINSKGDLMAHSAARRSAEIGRLETRISADKKVVLKNAADLSGRTLTDFVIDAAYEAAIKAIQEYQQLHLSIKDREVFVRALLNPPEPSRKLLRAVKKYKKDVISR